MKKTPNFKSIYILDNVLRKTSNLLTRSSFHAARSHFENPLPLLPPRSIRAKDEENRNCTAKKKQNPRTLKGQNIKSLQRLKGTSLFTPMPDFGLWLCFIH